MGTHVFGCDICQDVCPWNAQAATSTDPSWLPSEALDGVGVVDLWRLDDKQLRPVVKRSAMSRAGLRRLRRNTAVALGNTGADEASDALETPSYEGSRADPLVETHRAWARRRLRQTTGEPT